MQAQQLPIIPVDFSRRIGHNCYSVGMVGIWQLEGCDLHAGMRARFEERCELDMVGTLRLVEQGDQAYWVADVEPDTIRYHFTGTEFYVQPHEGTLTLGIEGTKEGGSLARFRSDSEEIVLTNYYQAVDARIHVEIWDGKQVWIAVPDWATYRQYPLDPNSDVEYPREGERLGRAAALAAMQSTALSPGAIESAAREAFIDLMLTQHRVIRGTTRQVYERFCAAFTADLYDQTAAIFDELATRLAASVDEEASGDDM